MKAFEIVHRFFRRLKYPVTLPEEITEALGVTVSKFLSLEELVHYLASSTCRPTRLSKFMSREAAESAFKSAQRKERFRRDTLVSYYFNEGWMEFILQFDESSRLRRVYIQHKDIPHERGIEIPLYRT